MAPRLSRLVLAALVASLVGCDHATKRIAAAALREHAPVGLVPGLLDLRYAENRGVAFDGVATAVHLPAIAMAAGALAILGLIVTTWWRRRRASALEHAGFALVLAGGIGNAVDRIVQGYVVDFVHLHHWPVFNLADVAIVVGVGLLAFGANVSRVRRAPSRG